MRTTARLALVVLVLAGLLGVTTVAVRAASTAETTGAGLSTVTVIEESVETQRQPSSDWTDGLVRATVSVPNGQPSFVRVRFSGASFCILGLDDAGDCRMRITYRQLWETAWTVASPGSVRFDGRIETSTEAFEAITPALDPGSYEIRVELWAGREGTSFGWKDYTVVIERIREVSS